MPADDAEVAVYGGVAEDVFQEVGQDACGITIMESTNDSSSPDSVCVRIA